MDYYSNGVYQTSFSPSKSPSRIPPSLLAANTALALSSSPLTLSPSSALPRRVSATTSSPEGTGTQSTPVTNIHSLHRSLGVVEPPILITPACPEGSFERSELVDETFVVLRYRNMAGVETVSRERQKELCKCALEKRLTLMPGVDLCDVTPTHDDSIMGWPMLVFLIELKKRAATSLRSKISFRGLLTKKKTNSGDQVSASPVHQHATPTRLRTIKRFRLYAAADIRPNAAAGERVRLVCQQSGFTMINALFSYAQTPEEQKAAVNYATKASTRIQSRSLGNSPRHGNPPPSVPLSSAPFGPTLQVNNPLSLSPIEPNGWCTQRASSATAVNSSASPPVCQEAVACAEELVARAILNHLGYLSDGTTSPRNSFLSADSCRDSISSSSMNGH